MLSPPRTYLRNDSRLALTFRAKGSSIGLPYSLTRNCLAHEQTSSPSFLWHVREPVETFGATQRGPRVEWMLTCNVRGMRRAVLSDRLVRLHLMSIQLVRLRGATRLYTKYSHPVKSVVRSSTPVIHRQTKSGRHLQPSVLFLLCVVEKISSDSLAHTT